MALPRAKMPNSELDEDENIWRLVSHNPERTQINYAKPSDDYFARNIQYQTATQKRQKQVARQVQVLAVMVGFLMIVTIGGMIRPRSQHQQQQAQQQEFAQQQGLAEPQDQPLSPEAPFSGESRQSTGDSAMPMIPDNKPSLTGIDRYVPIVTSETSRTGLTGYKSTWDLSEVTDIPVFFNVAYQLTGARIFKDILGICHHLTMAGEDVRSMLKELPQDTVEIVHSSEEGKQRLSLVNVDTTIISELLRAKKIGLVSSGLLDVMMIRHLYEANNIFDPSHRGRLFAIFRHPVHSAWGAYLAIENTHSELKDLTFEDYAASDSVENNWLVRALSNQPDGATLTSEHLQAAIEFVRDKILVGLVSKREESLERLEKFFGWKFHEDPLAQEQCRKDFLEGMGREKQMNLTQEAMMPKVAAPKPGEPIYDVLWQKNLYDVKLYEHITQLFEEQAALVANKPDSFRLVDASCCICTNSC